MTLLLAEGVNFHVAGGSVFDVARHLWREESARVSALLATSSEVSFGPQDFATELLHAGLCSVHDNRNGQQVDHIVVVLEELPGREGEAAAWGRRFQFVNGEQFFSRLDGMATAPPNKALQLTSALQASRGAAACCSLRSRGGSCLLAAGPGGLPFQVSGARS